MSVIVHKGLPDAKEAEDYLSISLSKLYDWPAKGKMPAVTIDACRLFNVKEFDQSSKNKDYYLNFQQQTYIIWGKYDLQKYFQYNILFFN